ncbi:hypothetical protein N7532_009531 [Penicillium argentinense]|uniref:Uncharacterized protein n=1 Tax=Penicillium argentinense TaxID=1131581 RepID=A0A9W9EZI4_9EURO|nr:uncharacterized protein N7532_009531 [Penicillium argentinense]KAJ5090847.1 hypothetical protein N7532_009531 [Penicillium argentinense]
MGGEEEANESLSGTSVQSAPDYVLNPLSIFRMARKSIPDMQAPEKAATSSAPNSTKPDSVTDMDRQLSDDLARESQNCGPTYPEVSHENPEELQSLFMSDLGWAWQPADTAVGSGIKGMPNYSRTH